VQSADNPDWLPIVATFSYEWSEDKAFAYVPTVEAGKAWAEKQAEKVMAAAQQEIGGFAVTLRGIRGEDVKPMRCWVKAKKEAMTSEDYPADMMEKYDGVVVTWKFHVGGFFIEVSETPHNDYPYCVVLGGGGGNSVYLAENWEMGSKEAALAWGVSQLRFHLWALLNVLGEVDKTEWNNLML
jgi:hypothetical protein